MSKFINQAILFTHQFALHFIEVHKANNFVMIDSQGDQEREREQKSK
jgi:hypothetical protein